MEETTGFLIVLIIVLVAFKCRTHSAGESFQSRDVINKGGRSTYKTKPGKTKVELHYTDWCPACQVMKPVWHEVAEELQNVSDVTMIMVDEEKTPTVGITAYPTIIRSRDGLTQNYHGRPDARQLRDWIMSTNMITTYGWK